MNLNPDDVWRRIIRNARQEFRLIRGRRFTYEIRGNSIYPSTVTWHISRTAVGKALDRVPLSTTTVVQDLPCPSYVFAILMDARIRARDW